MQINLNDMPVVDQTTLANILGVDRTTVRAYTQIGMPFIPGGRGESHQFQVPLCLHWYVGYSSARKHKLPEMTPLQYMLYGLTGALRDSTYSVWKRNANKLAEALGTQPGDVEEAVGFLRGARLLPWS